MQTTEVKQKLDRVEPSHETESMDRGEYEIDILELAYVLLENLRYLIAMAVAGALLAGIYTFLIVTPIYESTAKLYVLNSDSAIVNLADLQIGNYLASDYQEVFRTWEVNEKVITNLNLNYTYAQLQSMVSISNPSNTRILYITVRSSNREETALIANELANVVRETVAEIMSTEKPSFFSSALSPVRPSSPNKTRDVLIGTLLGAFLAMAILVVRFILDDKIKSADDIMKYAGIPTLAIVPVLNAQTANIGAGNKSRHLPRKKSE